MLIAPTAPLNIYSTVLGQIGWGGPSTPPPPPPPPRLFYFTKKDCATSHGGSSTKVGIHEFTPQQWYVAVWCSVVQCGAVCCSVLQWDAVRCSGVQCVVLCCSVFQCVALAGLPYLKSMNSLLNNSVLQRVPTCCRVVWCSVMQCDAV